MKHYRYQEQIQNAGYMDEFDFFHMASYDNVSLKLEEWDVVKETPKGYWIRQNIEPFWASDDMWVSKTSRKRFAYPTKEEALESFLIRKRKYLGHLERNLTNTKRLIQLAENLKDESKR